MHNLEQAPFLIEKNVNEDIINIDIKTWVKAATDDYTNEVTGLQGKIKQLIYQFLKEQGIYLSIIDLSLRSNLIICNRPTYLKLNIMFNPESYFNEKNIDFLCERFTIFFKSFNTICFSPDKNKLN